MLKDTERMMHDRGKKVSQLLIFPGIIVVKKQKHLQYIVASLQNLMHLAEQASAVSTKNDENIISLLVRVWHVVYYTIL